MSFSQFSPIVGLTPSAEAAMQNSGAQSQPGTFSQQDILSSASIFSPSSSESLTQEVTHSDARKENEDDIEMSQRICQEFEDIFGKAPNFSIYDLKLSTISVQDVVEEYSTQDFSPLLSQEPPASKRTKNWINDALDQAGYKMEIYLFQAIKAALIGLAEIPTSKEGAKQRLADILILITKALQEARTVRIQCRFGFRAATLMSADDSTGILIERQELILREARQEANARKKTAIRKKEEPERLEQETKGASTILGPVHKETEQRRQIGGRTALIISAWKRIGGEKLISRGVQAMWKSKQARKALSKTQFRDGALLLNQQKIKEFKKILEEQIRTGVVIPMEQREVKHRNNVFLIQKKSGSWRQILDCRKLNAVVKRTHFKCDGEKTVERLIRRKDYAIHGKRLLLQRNAFRLCRCTAPVHTYNEEGDSGDKKKMGCQSHCLFGRPSFSASRSANLEEHNTGDNRIFGKSWSADKHEEVQPHTEFAVQFPGIRIEYNQLRCVSNGGKKKGSARAVSQVGEKVHKSQDCQREGLSIIRGKAQFYTLRSARRIFAPPINLQIVAERSFNKRMGWNDEAECFNPPADKKMEMDIEEEYQTQTKSSVYSRSSSNHRCIRTLLGSSPQNKQNVTRLSQSFSILCEKPIIQLQRIKSSGTCINSLCPNPIRKSDITDTTSVRQFNSCFQREQMECRKESPSNTQKDMDIEGEIENSPESSSSPRITKHKSRCFVPPGKSWRLQNYRRRTLSDSCGAISYSNNGRLCSSTQPQGRALAWNRKPIGRRRSSISMEERVRSGTPPSSPDTNDDSEGTEGESTSSITLAELEWAELGCAIGEDASSDIRMEESENSTEKGTINGKHRCMSSSRPVKSHIDQSTRVKGESWWRRALEERSFPVSLAEECISGIAQSTWDGYLFGFAHFGEQWEKSDMGIIPEDIHEWAARCSSIFITLRDNGMKLSCLQLIRSAVSFFTSLVYNTNLGDFPIIKILFRGFRRTETTRNKKIQEIWNPKTILTYFSNLGENQSLSFKHLTMKAIVLTMLFTACRFTELERVDMERSIFEQERINLDTRLKTSLNRTEIAVPFLNENPTICPVSAIQVLWEEIQRRRPDGNKLFLNTETFQPLTVEGIRRLAKETLKEAGIQSHFTPYSTKDATLSTLTMSGIPPTQIAKFARLSPRTDTLVKHYVKANLASTLWKVIASTMNVPSEELATKLCSEDGGNAYASPERDQRNKNDIRAMESGMVLRDKKRLMKPCLSEEEARDTVEFPSRVDEPDEEMENQKSLKERFIIRTRSQAKKEDESNKAKRTHIVVVMMASSSN
ncbi:uncharacterized protein MONOS_8858 [Monocercomonoides exilis]|uniref:uncharacterized protein n=1 Tax=Monocercomonoides exilis TaxID=2049356 RepID=UPI003559E558|nr:hypothetical protein MONOS_8858 [Monocercomonoides exilis]|eukprot:MONOS_8858.1-p1 / transcript=MONOS_8858.1 / gene=MONOS_8858 / organism=Monocercomonoides_exilis_PA203 / gene_product=unspecified product / transcript_product=unspecified product / location=Mono_scaffold00346:44787-48957(+) / protein_length=1315 / sequence_SO=supercontig / SO=protein_coding / is_pseudo=false